MHSNLLIVIFVVLHYLIPVDLFWLSSRCPILISLPQPRPRYHLHSQPTLPEIPEGAMPLRLLRHCPLVFISPYVLFSHHLRILSYPFNSCCSRWPRKPYPSLQTEQCALCSLHLPHQNPTHCILGTNLVAWVCRCRNGGLAFYRCCIGTWYMVVQ